MVGVGSAVMFSPHLNIRLGWAQEQRGLGTMSFVEQKE
jgi:hypothetical protein